MTQLAWRYRVLRRPRLPAAMREVADAGGALVVVEGVSIAVHQRVRRMPGVRGASGTQLVAGGVVLLPGRTLLSAGKDVVVDHRSGDPGVAGQSVAFSADGIRLAIDVASVYGGDAEGRLELHYRVALGADVLSALGAEATPIRLLSAVASVIRPLPAEPPRPAGAA